MAAVASRPRNHSFAVFLGLYLPLLIRLVGSLLRPCLVAKFKISNYHFEIEFYMHGVLNLDEIRNKLHSLLIKCKVNLMRLIRL